MSALQEIDPELLSDFKLEFDDAYGAIESIIIDLEHSDEPVELLNDLFRRVHSIKSNLRMVALDDISDFVHHVEHMLEEMRAGKLDYAPKLGDVMLLSMDRVRTSVNLSLEGKDIQYLQLALLEPEIGKINSDNIAQLDELLVRVIGLMGGVTETVVASEPEKEVAKEPVKVSGVHEVNSSGKNIDEFHKLQNKAHQGASFWDDRVARIREMMSLLIEESGAVFDPEQFEVVLTLHDLALSMSLPKGCVDFNKVDGTKLAARQEKVFGLLGIGPDWEIALEILKHYRENVDGSGGPLGLKVASISESAQLFRIAHDFADMTNVSIDALEKKDIMRIVSAMNAEKGTFYTEKWINVFNQAIRKRVVKNRAEKQS